MPTQERKIRPASRAELEKWGVEGIRIALHNQTHIPDIDRQEAWDWLKEQDEKHSNLNMSYLRWTFWVALIAAVSGFIAAIPVVFDWIKYFS